MMVSEYLSDGTYVLNQPVTLTEVLDLLVVGGGPAGTAAAFHAKELGLSVLVIDYDDLMKRIRDYPKDKLILPDFGGGDSMRFPKGGDLIRALYFSPIDKDEMCVTWKELYRDKNVPAQVGIELLGLERRSDGIWKVKAWNHNTKTEQQYLARHIAIGIGRGVPRRFDIPGNTDGIAYRLADAAAYIGNPALVIGGGTSAAEAVIAISNQKVKSNDLSAVYWSYRGDKLPKVSKALAEVFFDAYAGNGNIRYFPNSDPVAVVTAEDKKDYLSVRIDRRVIPGRPNETSHLEFPKEFVITCIGEDIPEAFLNSLGITMMTGGASNKKRMTVTPVLETQQPNIYLIGDILSQAYLEADDFKADPTTFREVKHRGNIKAAMCDGVLVAEVTAQRVAGKKEIDVELKFEEADVAPIAAPVVATPIERILTAISVRRQTPKTAESVAKPHAYLVRVIAGSVEEEEFPLTMNGTTTIGRKFCDIVFPDDQYLSERHASIVHGPDGFSLRDDGSTTGVFVKAVEGKYLEVFSGDLLRLGRQFLVFNTENGPSLTHYDHTGRQVNRVILSDKTIVLGRQAPDVTLDPKDMTLSRRHLSISLKDGKILIKDLKSVNGTFIKVRTASKLEDGDLFRVGQQAFKLSLQTEKQPLSVHITTKVSFAPKPKPGPPTVIEQPAAEESSGTGVTIRNVDKSFPLNSGQTLCAVAEKNGVKITAECHAGICGSDPVRIFSGRENLSPLGDEEKGTLEDICGLAPGECRLACMAKASGPVEFEIL